MSKEIRDVPYNLYLGCQIIGKPYAAFPKGEKDLFEVLGNLIGITPGVLHCKFKDVHGSKWDEITRNLKP